MTERPGTKQAMSLTGRLIAFIKNIVSRSPSVSEKDGETLVAENDSELEKWANSTELKPPE